MTDMTLAQAVEQFTNVSRAWADHELDRPWAWRMYDEEGVRFAFFRTYEELRELAVALAAERAAQGPPVTAAQRVLGHYHAAFRDLRAVLLSAADGDLDRAPADGEWPLRAVLEHMIQADFGFFTVVRHALERHRRGEPAERMSREEWEAISDQEAPSFEAALRGTLVDIGAYHATLDERILGDLSGIGDEEIDAPSYFWEGEPFPLRFRLHRFDSHLRQHTVQAEKTLHAIGRPPTEARRLLRHIANALAEAEGVLIGAGGAGSGLVRETAAVITARANEIERLPMS